MSQKLFVCRKCAQHAEEVHASGHGHGFKQLQPCGQCPRGKAGQQSKTGAGRPPIVEYRVTPCHSAKLLYWRVSSEAPD
eukprot:3332755-Prymnesium_polylepis.1